MSRLFFEETTLIMSRKGNSGLKLIIITAFAMTVIEMDFPPLMIPPLCVEVARYPSPKGLGERTVARRGRGKIDCSAHFPVCLQRAF